MLNKLSAGNLWICYWSFLYSLFLGRMFVNQGRFLVQFDNSIILCVGVEVAWELNEITFLFSERKINSTCRLLRRYLILFDFFKKIIVYRMISKNDDEFYFIFSK